MDRSFLYFHVKKPLEGFLHENIYAFLQYFQYQDPDSDAVTLRGKSFPSTPFKKLPNPLTF